VPPHQIQEKSAKGYMSFAAFGTISGSQAAFGTNVRATGSYLKAGTVSTVTSIEAIKPLN
jgi:hypothetical protein